MCDSDYVLPKWELASLYSLSFHVLPKWVASLIPCAGLSGTSTGQIVGLMMKGWRKVCSLLRFCLSFFLCLFPRGNPGGIDILISPGGKYPSLVELIFSISSLISHQQRYDTL